MNALVPHYGTQALQKYDEFRTLLEMEYDEEIKNDKDRVKKEKIDMRKMLREHEEGTERLMNMTNRR